jgi:hypothetical protein
MATELEQIQALMNEFRRPCVANSRVFKRDRQRYIHFITLGVGDGEYVDLIVDNPIKYGSGSVIVGQGKRQNQDGSQFLQVNRSDIKSFEIEKYLSNRA